MAGLNLRVTVGTAELHRGLGLDPGLGLCWLGLGRRKRLGVGEVWAAMTENVLCAQYTKVVTARTSTVPASHVSTYPCSTFHGGQVCSASLKPGKLHGRNSGAYVGTGTRDNSPYIFLDPVLSLFHCLSRHKTTPSAPSRFVVSVWFLVCRQPKPS